MTEREQILASLEPLFDRAQREKKVFRSVYQGIYFTPKQLRSEHAKGSFIWGPVNWELVPAIELLAGFEKEARSAEQRVWEWTEKLRREGLL